MADVIAMNLPSGLALNYSAPNSTMTLEERINLVVPTGVTYKVVDISTIPEDRTTRDTWTVDFTDGIVKA